MREVKQLGDASKTRKSVKTKDRSSKEVRTVKIQYPWLYASIVLFLTVPLFMFFMGYLKLIVGIPLTLIFGGLLLYAVSDCANDPDGHKLSLSETTLEVPVSYIIGFAVIALLISYVSGVGEYIYSLQDHEYRRAILRDLIDYDWPVIYNYKTQTNPEVIEIFKNASGNRAFSYYFIYWMPAALVGKMFGFNAGNFVLFLWNSVGIFLSFLGASAAIKKFTYWVPFIFVFFSGLDAIPNMVYELTQYDGWRWFEGYVTSMSYVSNFREMASVFNQMIPCFLVVCLLMMSFNVRSMGLTSGILFCYSPWAVFGILPMVIATLCSKKHRASKVSRTITNALSPSNIASAMFILLIFGSYYMTNSAAVSYKGFAWQYFDSPLKFVIAYIVFVLIEVIPFALILYKSEKSNIVYWAAFATLLILPFYRISEMNDFTMRGSMPALFFFSIALTGIVAEIMDKKNTPTTKKGWLKPAAVMLTVIIMMFTTLLNLFVIFGSIIEGDPGAEENIGSFGNINQAEYAEVIQEQFFAEGYEDSFFYKYFAR